MVIIVAPKSGMNTQGCSYSQKLMLAKLWQKAVKYAICDMIKRSESDVSHIVFEILAKTVFKFLQFLDKFFITL